MVQRRSVLRLALAGPALALAPRLVAASHSLPPAFRRQLERDPNAPALGNPDGNATLVEFFDYNCQFCRAMLPVVGALLDTDRSLRLVMREWPVFGPGSEFAARASLATLPTGNYWRLHAALLGMRARAEEFFGRVPQAEDGWKRIRIGELEFEVAKGCSRCILTTIDPQSGERNAQREPLATLKTYRERDGDVYFGQNLLPRGVGELQVGMTVEVLE